jgi:hypothetical protein
MATRRACLWGLLSALGLAQTGCSILSPIPTWELLKGAGTFTSTAIQSQPGEPSNTVTHAHAPFKALCIEYNPQTQVADIVPALQAALQQMDIESRVYDGQMAGDRCPVWLRYTAYVQWDTQSLSDVYIPYISNASLVLQASTGKILASSNYVLDSAVGRSKWASTRDKLAPVLGALINGLPERSPVPL